jgi:hypothetical protein
MAAFCMFVCVYFLEPSLAAPKTLAARENQQLLAWLPSYRFLGLFQGLNGSMHTTMAPLARRALTGLAVAVLGAGAAFLFSYFRTLRKIVEEPDFAAGSRGANWSPRFGNSLDTAVVLFSIRTLLRSRQHRVILAFYLGVGFASVLLFMKTPHAQQQLLADHTPLLFPTVVMMCFWVVGTRVVFSMPLDLRANSALRRFAECGISGCDSAAFIRARRGPGLGGFGGAASFDMALANGHGPSVSSRALGIDSGLRVPGWLSEDSVHLFLLPGKSYVHMVFLASMGILLLILKGVEFERRALQETRQLCQDALHSQHRRSLCQVANGGAGEVGGDGVAV